jgi:Uma2 family endonuclease
MSETSSSNSIEQVYLETDTRSAVRHELIGARTVAMGGASRQHNHVAMNCSFALRSMATGSQCRTTMETVRLRVDETNSFYPDVMVSCEPNEDTHAEHRPCLIAEILSPSTSWVDHGRKRAVYMELDSLRHYLLVDIQNRLIEHLWRSSAAAEWTRTLHGTGDHLELHCPEGTLPVDVVFAGWD